MLNADPKLQRCTWGGSNHIARAGAPAKSGRSATGFTLIELLVVVAIIALLIAILLPSLSKARAQARATLCASRISQMAKAMFIYADDYDETPPFLGRGWENADDAGQDSQIWPASGTMTVRDWKYAENWLMPDMPDYWTKDPAIWPDYARVRDGSLFAYTRFEMLYRCPEFERISDPRKSQNDFNYTRDLLCRKWYHCGEPEGQEGSPWYFGNWAGAPGPTMRIGQVFAPARLHLMHDERWDRHCAALPEDQSPPAPTGEGLLAGKITGTWMAADPLCGLIGDEIGRYHGSPMSSEILPDSLKDKVLRVRRGSTVMFDGHVELLADPLPDRNADIAALGIGGAVEAVVVFLDWVKGRSFAQRGITDVVINSPL